MVKRLAARRGALVQGFKHAPLPAIEVWLATGNLAQDLDQIDRIAEFMLAGATRFEYAAPERATCRVSPDA